MNAVEVIKAATQAINEGRIEEALAFYTEDVIQRSPATGEAPGFKVREGKEALRQVLLADRENRVQFLHRQYIAEGDWVAVQGVNMGVLFGAPVEQPVAVFYEVEAEKIRSVTVYYDRLVLSKLRENAGR